MSATARVWGCAIGLFCLVSVGWAADAVETPAKSADRLERGRVLFERVWTADPGGGGLGPMFNERSCAACHSRGGIGGAGSTANNVQLLTVKPPKDSRGVSALMQRLPQLHVGFAASTSIVLHRNSTNAGYPNFVRTLLAPKSDADSEFAEFASFRPGRPVRQPAVKAIDKGDLTLLLSERSTTPLFGAGLIDQIPQAVIEEVATKQRREDPNVSGRFVGRFGWRGQVLNLRSFVLGACAVEIGLQNKEHASALDPVDHTRMPGVDLCADDCDALVAFCAALPAPTRAHFPIAGSEMDVVRGEHTFHDIGCVVCHRPQLGTVVGIYSDLLTHDMGVDLEDPAAPVSAVKRRTRSVSARTSNGYSGPPLDLTTPLVERQLRDWKTPPLWGLRDSAPYLHDGRAATIEEAIVAHAGEARRSIARYHRLTPTQRQRLLFFLSSLIAPDSTALAAVGRVVGG